MNLFREGNFYKAYERSAYLLCTFVHPFKVNVRSLKGLDEPLVSIGFPLSSYEKFCSGMIPEAPIAGQPDSVVLSISPKPDFAGFVLWKSSVSKERSEIMRQERRTPHFNNLPVYGVSYRLALDVTNLCSSLDRRFRYSLGEDLRNSAKQIVLNITWAGKDDEKVDCIVSARHSLTEMQLCLRLLNDLKAITDKRYVSFLELTNDLSSQLSKWEQHSRQYSSPEYRHRE